MSGGFGRKGVVAGGAGTATFGASNRSSLRPAAPAAGPDDGLSPQARAFIAAERARSLEQRPSADPMASAAASATYLAPSKPKSDRSMVVAYVLWWFGALLSAHRFYLGAYRSAAAQLGLFWGGLAIGGMMSKKSTLWIGGVPVPPPGIMMILICMVWVLLDVFLIPGLVRRYRESRHTDTLAHVFT